MLPIEVHPEAEDELMEAKAWYRSVISSVVERFAAEVDRALNEVAAHPTRWPTYLGDTRHYLMSRFPYMVVYRVLSDRIQVLAIAHMKRDPAYWNERLGNPNDTD